LGYKYFENWLNVPVSNRFMHQFGGDSTIDSAADRPDHPALWSADFTNASNLLANEFFLERDTISCETKENANYGP
jgi:hypothetical protein